MGAAEDLAKQLSKQFGESDTTIDDNQSWLNSGISELNKIVSGKNDKGFPQGRIVEIFGPASCGKTALATMLMIAAQKQGGCAIFVDWERSFMVGYAEKLGLNSKSPFFYYKKPKTWEEGNTVALQMADMIRKSGLLKPEAPIVIVFDSVASAVPKSVFDKGIDELTMNDTTALARVTSTTLKSINSMIDDLGVTAIYLNQVRTKIGVMFGDPTCLHGNTVVPFVDGTFSTMKEIVDNKISKEVWSYNELTGEFEAKAITGWHNNGPINNPDDWIKIQSKGLHTKNGVVGITVTPEHKILTDDGWKAASQISLGDKLTTRRKSKLNGTYEQFLRAAMSGDAHVLQAKDKNRNGCVLRIQDNNDIEYARWKVNKLSAALTFKESIVKIHGKDYTAFTTSRADEDVKLVNDELKNNRCPLQMLNQFTPMMMAVWIMDDGHLSKSHNRYTLSIKRYARSDDLARIADRLFKLGYDFGVRGGEGTFVFNVETSKRISKEIAPFVPKCMERKLLDDDKGKYVDFDLSFKETIEAEPAEVIEIRQLGEKVKAQKNRQDRYDITVKDNHNYMVGNSANGVIVHNCTPGGAALEFYASVRLSLGKKLVKDGKTKEVIAHEIKAKTVKNKLTRPHQEASWRIVFEDEGGVHFDVAGALIDALDKAGKLEKSGNYYVFDGKKMYRNAFVDYVEKNGKIAELEALMIS